MAAGDDEIGGLGVAELAERIRDRRLSPVEVVEATLRRIEARDPSLNAFVYVDPEGALEAARAAESAVMAGGPLGPLHGVPTALKDLFSAKTGWPTTYGGIPALKHWKADHNGLFCERIEAAGAILVGRTNSPAFGFRGITDNYLFGPTGNPFDATRNPGGSSGGSAAAVGDGMLPFAEATDGGGSIRIPAAWSGLFGYKASWGRVPQVVRPNAFSSTDPFIFTGTVAPFGRRRGAGDGRPDGAGSARSVLPRRRARPRGGDPQRHPRHAHRVQPRSRHLPRRPPRRRDGGRGGQGLRGCGRRGRGGEARADAHPEGALRPLVPDDHPAVLRRARGHQGGRHRPPARSPERPAAADAALDRARLPPHGGGGSPRPGDPHRDLRRGAGHLRPLRSLGVADARRDAGEECDRRQHHRADGDQRRGRRSADRLVHDGDRQLHRSSGGIDPGRSRRRAAVGLQIMGRRGRDIDVFAASAAFEAARPWAASYAIPAARPLTPPSAARSG